MESTGQKVANQMERMRVSVIIPTVGRKDDLKECLRSIRKSNQAALCEIVIVDDMSDKRVRTEPDLYQGVPVRIIRNDKRKGAAQSRNIGAKSASGDVLAFLDDDVRIPWDWFLVIQRELTNSRTAITGPVIGFDSSVIARARQNRYDSRYHGKVNGEAVCFLAGGNCAIWRTQFVAAGGFPVIATMSDRVLAARLMAQNQPCQFIWALKVTHRNSKGMATAISQAFKAGMVSAEIADLSGAEPRNRESLCQKPRLPLVAFVTKSLSLVFATGYAYRRIIEKLFKALVTADTK